MMKPSDLHYLIIAPLLRGIAIGIGAIAAAAIIALMFSLAISIAG